MRIDDRIEQIIESTFIGVTDIEFFDCFSTVVFNINRNEVSYRELFRLATQLKTDNINFIGDKSKHNDIFDIPKGVIYVKDINIKETLDYPTEIIRKTQ